MYLCLFMYFFIKKILFTFIFNLLSIIYIYIIVIFILFCQSLGKQYRKENNLNHLIKGIFLFNEN